MNIYNNLEIRCPRLGHEVPFSYCRREAGDLPCLKILSCWQPFFPVESMLKEEMPAEVWVRFMERKPKDKLVTIIDLIEAAKRRREREAG
ncbi:MAG: hypothetical protein PHN75_08885 [Syntrophales bacterium]|nr:hypothetical protein [Syntrophales bacterium]